MPGEAEFHCHHHCRQSPMQPKVRVPFDLERQSIITHPVPTVKKFAKDYWSPLIFVKLPPKMFRDWILSWKSLYLSIWPSTNPLSSPRLHFARNVEVWVQVQVASLRFSKCCAVPTMKNFAKAGNLNSIHMEFGKPWQQLDREEAPTMNWKFV